MVNLYISYLLNEWSKDLNTDFTLGNCLFGVVKLTKKPDPDKYEHSGYGEDLIHVHSFHGQMEAMEKCSYFCSW